jgi:hypothetical protein
VTIGVSVTAGLEDATLCYMSYGVVSGSGSITVDSPQDNGISHNFTSYEEVFYYTVHYHSGAAGGSNTLPLRAHDQAEIDPVVTVGS